MGLLSKLFGSKAEPAPPPPPPKPAEAPPAQVWNAAEIVPLTGINNPADVLGLLRAGKFEQAFSNLNSLKGVGTAQENVDYLRAHIFLLKNQAIAAYEALKEELRYFPRNKLALQAFEKLQSSLAQESKIADPEFRELLGVIRPYTMVGEERLYSLFKLAREVCAKDLPGNFVECGVAAGGSSALLAAVIKRHSKRPRRLFSLDTFEGMPEASHLDSHLGTPAEATGWGKGTCAAPIDSLLEAAGKLDATDFVRPVKGLFADTLPGARAEIGPIAFLHVDGDWYSSTMDVLGNLYDQVTPGAPIQVDDYGFWEGCKRALDEFQQQRGLAFELHKIDFTGVWFHRP